MLNQLDQYLSAWNLSDPQLLAQTPTSHLYTVALDGSRAVLKLLTPLGEQDERFGAIALRYWNGRGVVRLLKNDDYAQLLEFAPGEHLVAMVERGDDERATETIAEVLNAMHVPPTGPLPNSLRSLRVWFRALFAKAAQDTADGIDSPYVRAARLADELLNDPRDVRVLHGDIHHFNIRHHPQRGWLAFDPKGLIGERTYDTANTLCNPYGFPELLFNERRMLTTAGILADGLEIDRWRVLAFAFAYVCLSASWYLEDGERAEREMRIAAMIEPHLG